MSTSSPRRPGPRRSTPAPPASSPASVRPPSRQRPCATPQVVLSGHVDTTGPVPLANVCVFVVDASGNGGQAMTDAQGNWSVSGLPAGFNVVVDLRPVLQRYQGSLQGQRRRERATRARARSTPARLLRQHLGQPRRSHLSERPLPWGVAARGHHLERAHRQRRRLHHQRGRHRGPKTELQPDCRGRGGEWSDHRPAAAAPSGSPLLAFTGATFLPLVTFGSGLLLAGLALLAISWTGRRRWLHCHLRASAVPLRHTNRRTGPLSRIRFRRLRSLFSNNHVAGGLTTP